VPFGRVSPIRHHALVNWLLLPADEVEFVTFMTEELGLDRIVGHDAENGSLPVRFGNEPKEIVWWAPDLGPIERMGDAPAPTDEKEVVLLRLNREADPETWAQRIDSRRTPIIRFHRANWNQNGCLNPGLLQGMSVPVKEQPPELLRLLRSAEKWLQREGEKINPFRHTIATPVPEPERLGALTAWARPHALAWITDGGKVWPWNA
jgi:hypothetical protein